MASREGCREAARRLLRRSRRPRPSVAGERTPWRDPRARACCALAVLAIGGSLALVLSRPEQRRSGTNGVFGQARFFVPGGMTACQGRELLPAHTAGLAIAGLTSVPPVVVVRRGGHVLDRVGSTIDVRDQAIQAAIAPEGRDLDGVEVCLALASLATLARGPTPPHSAPVTIGRAFVGSSLAITYLLPGQRSWWAHAGTVAARMGRGRGDWGGNWAVWSIVALVGASLLLAGCIALRTLVSDQPMPRIAGAIMAVAVLNAAAWSFITPAFQVPDEAAHVAYVQSIGETGNPPTAPPSLTISPEQATAMADTMFGKVGAATYGTSVWLPSQQRRLVADLRRPLSRRETIRSGEAEPEPPLYYALEAIPYRAATRATLLDRIMLMRLLSALLAGFTALFSYLFVRECLPARPWAWTVGGLGVALTPMLGSISGGINPDALLFALTAALFLCIARAWRRGVTLRSALGVGALIAAGMLTKVNFYGVVPGALLGLALAARRTGLAQERRVVHLVGAAVVLAATLFAVGAAFDVLAWHRPFLAARPVAPESRVSLWSHLGYVWQVFLPRLPFQPQTSLTEPGYIQLFQTFVGAFGQLVVWFPRSVYRAAAVGLLLAGLLAVSMVMADRRELRWRRGELLGYAAMAGGLLLLVGLSADLRRNLIGIVQGRYLLPLLPLFGLLLALGARGAGERWGRSVGVAIVAAALAWSLFGQLLTIAFFYG
ncbi:MAG TPA: DUF2142 domain-containing protein [Conexibacter sp.]|jgi:hypothetical protein|nr:DUF2142 domain-containing protein [Conexibacter sp.]